MNTKMQALIAKKAAEYVEKGWTKDRLAATKTGKATLPESRYAVEWCVVGAIERAAHDYGERPHHDWGAPEVILGLCNHLRLREDVEDYLSKHSAVVKWNNNYARDGEEVATALKGLAAKLEAME